MNYNNTIVQKVVDYITNLLPYVTMSDEQERSINLLNYKMVTPDNLEINTLFTKGLTSSITVLFNFEILDKDGKLLEEVSAELAIPKLINNIFVIEGVPRIPTQSLDNDYICRVYKDNIVFNRNISVSYGYDDNGVLNYDIIAFDDLGTQYTFTQREDIDVSEVRKILKLGETERLKLQVKLDRDYVPDYVTTDIIMNLIKLGPDMFRDSIIDKSITTTETNLIHSLYQRSTRSRIIQSMAKKFYQYGSVYLTDIQNGIDRYFKVADESSIDIPATVNPLIYDALKYKITVPKHVAYNKSMSDLIDPVNTPENNNVNRLNELNICASIEDGVTYITCYDIHGNKVKLPYLQYLNRKVLVNSDFNYELGEPIEKDSYTIKLRLKEHKVDSISDIEDLLVEPSPDEKLSITTRRIPMINMSDSVRIAMASSMEKQAIEVEASEVALVSSGNDDADVINSALITRFTGVESVVEMINGNRVFLKDTSNGSISFYDIGQPTVGANDSLITFESSVKVGDKVKKGDVLITPKILKNNSYELGVNARVFYMNYLGYTHEDGIVLSQSFANKLTSYSTIDISVSVKERDIVRYMRKIGERVTSKDVLVNIDTPLRGARSTNEVYDSPTGLLNFASFNKASNNLTVPNGTDLGYVVAVLVQENSNPDIHTKSEVTKKTIDEFLENKETSKDWDTLPEKYRHLHCLPGELHTFDSYLITYKIIKVRPAMIGSKLANRYGSKGEVSLILPDNLMPRLDEDGNGNGLPAEILLNPAAVISRKNPSQLYETILTKIIQAIYNKVMSLIASNQIQEAKKITVPYYGSKFMKMDNDSFIKEAGKGIYTFKMNVGSFAKVSYETVMGWAKKLGLSETQDVYCPDVFIVETNDGLQAYDPDAVDRSKLKGGVYHELGFLEQPVITGSTYMMKLYHSADYVGKVTPNDIESKEPYMKRGLYRFQGGQKIGEMEFWSLLSYGTEKFIREGSDNMLLSQYEFINEILLAGYTLVDNKGLPLLSDYRSKVRQLVEKK